MQDENEYERLLKEGYIVEGKVDFNMPLAGELTTLKLTEEAIKKTNAKQVRRDKTVVVHDKLGQTKKISSIMMGYNKQGINLADGTFANASELLTAMEVAVTKQASGKIVINTKGQYFEPNLLLEVATRAAGKVVIGKRYEKITNQDSRRWSIEGSEGTKANKGVAFLGNKGLVLPTGDYVSIEELMKALNDYMILKPKEVINPPSSGSNDTDKNDNDKDKEDETEKKEQTPKTVRVQKKYKNRASYWLILMALLATTLSGLGKTNITVDAIKLTEEKIMQYDMTEMEYLEEDIQDSVNRVIMELGLGDSIKTNNGDTLNTNSVLTGINKTFGQEFDLEGKKAGDYRITGISIVHNGNILDAIEDYNGTLDAPTIGEYVQKVCDKNNVSIDDINIRVHLGSSKDNTRAGWADITDLIDAEDITEDMIKTIITPIANYTGVINNFNGKTITMDNGVQLQIVDATGKLLQTGTEVIGSDGKKYIINNLDLMIASKEATETNIIGQKLVWNVGDCELSLALIPLLAATALAIKTKMQNKKASENPTLTTFTNPEDYEKFVEEFEKAKAEYNKKSKFQQMLKRVFYQDEVDLLRNLDDKQTIELYNTIMQHAGLDFPYDHNSHITIDGGKIWVIYQNGQKLDITDYVIEDIRHIGSNNDVTQEGLLTDEVMEYATSRK